jgi:hypothetical protein
MFQKRGFQFSAENIIFMYFLLIEDIEVKSINEGSKIRPKSTRPKMLTALKFNFV